MHKHRKILPPFVLLFAACIALAVPAHGGTAAADDSGGTVFGSTIQLLPREQWAAGIARTERADGPLGAIRVFQTVPRPAILGPLAGRSAIISFDLPPADVLAGTYDAQFTAFFAAAPTDHPTWWSYYHEADVAYTHGRLTDLQQLRDAYTHVALLARAADNPELRNAVILVDYTANPRSGLMVSQFMPAAGLTDLIAWDTFDGWFQRTLGTYGDPTRMLALEQSAAAGVGLPWAVAEFGSSVLGTDVQGRAEWIRAFCGIAENTGAQFVSYFDYHKLGSPADYRLLDEPSRAAWAACARGATG